MVSNWIYVLKFPLLFNYRNQKKSFLSWSLTAICLRLSTPCCSSKVVDTIVGEEEETEQKKLLLMGWRKCCYNGYARRTNLRPRWQNLRFSISIKICGGHRCKNLWMSTHVIVRPWDTCQRKGKRVDGCWLDHFQEEMPINVNMSLTYYLSEFNVGEEDNNHSSSLPKINKINHNQ